MKQLSGVLVLFALLFKFSSGQSICCQSASTFQVCFNLLGIIELTVGPVISCPTGYTCDASTNSPCVLDSTTTTAGSDTTTATPFTTTTVPVTTTTAPVTTTTTPAATTNPTTTASVESTTSISNSTTAPVTTTILTTTAATTTACPEGQTGTAPTCTAADTKYPGPSCDQYYECISVWWWYEYRLRTCGSGLTYSSAQEECVSAIGSCTCVD